MAFRAIIITRIHSITTTTINPILNIAIINKLVIRCQTVTSTTWQPRTTSSPRPIIIITIITSTTQT